MNLQFESETTQHLQCAVINLRSDTETISSTLPVRNVSGRRREPDKTISQTRMIQSFLNVYNIFLHI